MSLRERVRLLRKELCDEVIVELDRLEAEIATLRAELAAMNKRWTDAEYEFRAAARQDAEEKARLKGALKDALDYIGGLVHPGALPKWFEDARRIAALACRPQEKNNG